MTAHVPFDNGSDSTEAQDALKARNYENNKRSELEAIVQALAKLTQRSAKQIQPYLDDLVVRVQKLEEPSFE